MVKPGSLDPDMHLDLEVKWLSDLLKKHENMRYVSRC